MNNSFDPLTLVRSSLAPIAEHLADSEVNEIMINGPDDVWIERRGQMHKLNACISKHQIDGVIKVLASLANKDTAEGTERGMVNARMPGFRVGAVMQPTSIHGPSLAIRKHSTKTYTLDDFVAAGSLSVESADVLRRIIREKRNILVAGGTSSGKTTFLNALIAEIDPQDRVVTIEDTAELNVRVPNWVPFESNKESGVTTVSLVEMSLRYRPDRILVGELRGPEAAAFLEAANTGHDGCLTTLHANSSIAALQRMETLVLRAQLGWPLEAISKQIGDTLDYVVFMKRANNGIRQLFEILEIQGFDTASGKYLTNPIFTRSS